MDGKKHELAIAASSAMGSNALHATGVEAS